MDAEGAQALIDDEILSLKTRRNTYARISRLPHEVLLEIFATLKEDLGSVLEWHHVAHICRHWRRVVLESATMWTNPPGFLHDYTLIMLDRSRTSPLVINIGAGTSEDTLLAILSHIGRIKSLSIDHWEPVLQIFQNHLQSSAKEASLLCSISITLANNFAPPGKPFRLSDTIFTHFPTLRQLHLTRVVFDWGLFPLKATLSHLCLTSVELSQPTSWTQFYGGLQQMSSLEHLRIFNFDQLQLISPPHYLVRPFGLPILRGLIIEGSCASMMASFLNNSSFPRLQSASIKCRLDAESGHNGLSTIIRAALSLIPKGSFGYLDELDINGHLSFRLNRSSDIGHFPDFTNRMAFSIYIPRRARKAGISQELMEGLAALPPSKITSQIRHLSMFAISLSAEQFSEYFACFTHLEAVSISDIASSQKMVEALRIPHQYPLHLPPPFSNLKSLRVLGPRGPRSEEDIPEFLERLTSLLARRLRYNVGLSHLYVSWDLGKEDVRRLQDVVVDVQWGDLDSDDEL